MSAESSELKDLVSSLRRRASMSAASDWTQGANDSARAPSRVVETLPEASRRAREEGGDAPKTQVRSQPLSPTSDGPSKLAQLAEQIKACQKCPLGASRIQAVPGVGTAAAKVMFIGEGPGFDEDHKGEPFVGRSGQLLDKIMAAIGLSRETVYIANIVKCHPMIDPTDPEKRGNDRPPTPEEMEQCRGWLEEQIRTIAPRVIVTLGAVPARALLRDMTPISKIRGKWRTYDPGGGLPPIKLLPTFHPAALLRNPDLKRDVWEDMKALRQEIQ